MKTGQFFDVPEGIIAHLMGQWEGNMHDRHIVDVISASFEEETSAANRNS
jgi:hypothetical protein